MTLRTLGAAIVFSLATATASNAVTVTVGGSDYDVTTITGTYSDNQALLESQIWWDDQGLAGEFAATVGSALGAADGFTDRGPSFAYDSSAGLVFSSARALSFPSTFFSIISVDEVSTFALASPINAVPLPAGGILLLTGLAGIAGFRRRKQSIA